MLQRRFSEKQAVLWTTFEEEIEYFFQTLNVDISDTEFECRVHGIETALSTLVQHERETRKRHGTNLQLK